MLVSKTYIAHHNSSNSIKPQYRLLLLEVGEEDVVGVLQHQDHHIYHNADKVIRFP